MTYIPSLGGRLKLGAGWCNTPSPVLRGAGNESLYDRDIVAPPGNQAANREHKQTPKVVTGRMREPGVMPGGAKGGRKVDLRSPTRRRRDAECVSAREG